MLRSLFCFKLRRSSCSALPRGASLAPAESVTQAPAAAPSMCADNAARAHTALRSRRPPPPMRLSPDERKVMLAEMSRLEDLPVRDDARTLTAASVHQQLHSLLTARVAPLTVGFVLGASPVARYFSRATLVGQLFDFGVAPKPHHPGRTQTVLCERGVVLVIPRSAATSGDAMQDLRNVAEKYDLQPVGGGGVAGTRLVVLPLLDFGALERSRTADRAARAKHAAAAAEKAAVTAAPAEEAPAATAMPLLPPSSCKPATTAVPPSAALFARAGALAMLPPTHAVMQRGGMAA